MIVAWGLMERITPFMLATNQSRSPKSVRRVMIEVGCGMRTVFNGREWPRLQFLELDLDHLVLDDLHGRRHFDEVAEAFADQCPAYRRLNRDPIEFHVGLVLADQGVLALRLGLLFDHRYSCAEHDGVGASPRDFDDSSVGQLGLDFGDARLDEALALFGRVIFRIFAEISMGTGFGNGLDHLRSFDFPEAIELRLERIVALFCNRCRHSPVIPLAERSKGVESVHCCYDPQWYSCKERMVNSFLRTASIPMTAARAPRMVV